MQSMWKQKLDWDEHLPDELQAKWTSISRDLSLALETSFERYLHVGKQQSTLHVFTYASIHAYGASANILSEGISTLVMAKNRIAPIKSITLPKLELMGAVIGAKLAQHICKNLPGNISDVTFWSDSQIVLSWLSCAKPQKQFIQNRVTEIRNSFAESSWRCCLMNFVRTRYGEMDLYGYTIRQNGQHGTEILFHLQQIRLSWKRKIQLIPRIIQTVQKQHRNVAQETS